MEDPSSKWYSNPSRKQLLIVFLVWVISISLVVLSTTDVFQHAVPFNIVLLLILPSFIVVVSLYLKYSRNKPK